MLNTVRKIYSLITVCIVMIMISPSACYCSWDLVETQEIVIASGDDWGREPWYLFEGEPDVIQVLITRGIQKEGAEGLITTTTDAIDPVEISAQCVPVGVTTVGAEEDDSYEDFFNMWPPGRSHTCGEGEGVQVMVSHPMSPYQYIATLQKFRRRQTVPVVVTPVDLVSIGRSGITKTFISLFGRSGFRAS